MLLPKKPWKLVSYFKITLTLIKLLSFHFATFLIVGLSQSVHSDCDNLSLLSCLLLSFETQSSHQSVQCSLTEVV